jgi:hypothetical protein
LEEPAEGTQFRSDPQPPPALPYPHLPQASSTLPTILHDGPGVSEGYASLTATGISHNAPEVDEGYVSKGGTPQGTYDTPTTFAFNKSIAPAPFYPDANPGTHYNGPFAPQMFRQYPGTNAGQGPENRNVYQYPYYGSPTYNMYPGPAQSSIPYTPSFNPISPGFSPRGPSGPHKSGTDSGYSSLRSSPGSHN